MNVLDTLPRRPALFLLSGILCHTVAAVLTRAKEPLVSSAPFLQCSRSLELLMDHLWSAPAALTLFLILALLLGVYCSARALGKKVPWLLWLDHPSLPSRLTFWGIMLFFIYTLLPLYWAQRDLPRAPEAFPDYTPFEAVLMVLSLAGTVSLCLYCFVKLPPAISRRVEALLSRLFRCKERYVLGILLALCLLTTSTIAYGVLDHIPHVQDSIAQLFHAKIFLTGKLTAPLPPLKEFFDYPHIINDTGWYSQYPPGHSLLLMLGLLAGAPWLVGPLLGTLSLLIFYRITKSLYRDRRTSYLSTGLLLFSPFFLFMSSSHMNHTSTLFFVLLFLYYYIRIFSSPAALPALISGLSLGYGLHIRPLDAAAVSLPFMGTLIYYAWKTREPSLKKVMAFFIGVSLLAGPLLLYNKYTNGSPFLFGYQKKYQTAGFLGSAQQGPPHTLKGGIVNTSNNLTGLNKYLFEWPIPSLSFIFIFLLIPCTKNRWEYLFIGSSLSLIFHYFFYYHQDYIFGPRFYYSIIPFLIILTVRGLLALPPWLEKKHFNRKAVESTLYLLLAVCLLSMLSFSLPSLIKKYAHDYWWVTDRIQETVKREGITNAIVFIDCWHPPDSTRPNLIYYGSGFQFNSPDLRDDVIYALDLRERNGELMKLFPDRKYYSVPFFWDRTVTAW